MNINKNTAYGQFAYFWGNDKPQTKCFEYGLEHGHTCYMATDEKGGMYYSFPSYKIFMRYHNQTKSKRNWYEVIRDQTMKLYIDYDQEIRHQYTESDQKKVIDYIKKLLSTKLEFSDSDLVILDSCRLTENGSKISYHFILNNSECFESITHLKRFMKLLKMEDKNDDLIMNIDMAVYSRNRRFRIMGSSKLKAKNYLKGLNDVKFEDSFVQHFKNQTIKLYESIPDANEVDVLPNNNNYNNLVKIPAASPAIVSIETPISDFEYDNVILKFNEFQLNKWGTIKHSVRDYNFPFINLKNIETPRTVCCSCNVIHEQDNYGVIRLNEFDYYYMCRKKTSIKHTIFSIPIKDRPVSSSINPNVLMKKSNNDIIYESRFVKELNLDTDYFIKSQLGTGKTFQFSKLIIKLLNRNSKARIIIFSQRIQFSREICAKINSKLEEVGIEERFVLYKDSNDQVINDAQLLVMGVHSLHKLKIYENPRYDLVIGDEIRSLFSEFLFKHLMKNNYSKIAINFETIFRQCKNFIVCDAFATQSDITKLSLLMNGTDHSDFTLIQNIWKPQRREIEYLGGSFTNIVNKIYEKLLLGERCVFFSSIATSARNCGLVDFCKRNNITYAFYHSKSNDKAKKEDFENINESWKVQLLIYTPTITVGVSFDELHFDNLFVYFSTYSACVRDCFQSMYRVRQFKSTKIYCGIYDKPMRDAGSIFEKQIKIDCFNEKEAKRERLSELKLNSEFADTDLNQLSWISESIINNEMERNFHKKYIVTMIKEFCNFCNIFFLKLF